MEILDCCRYLGLPCDVEDKQYARDWWLSRGRVRVQLRDLDSGAPVNPDIPSRRELLLRVADLVARHPGRHAPRGGGKAGGGASGSGVAAAGGASGSGAGGGGAAGGGGKAGGGGSSKKKGKKK